MSLRSEIVRVFNELIAGSKKITQLPPASTLAGTELMEIVQDGENRKATASQFGGGSGATQFTQLTDVPNDYSGAAGLAVTVNATEDGLEFTSGGGGGAGTVTDVSIVTANGVSGSVATSTTTPAITLTLGAITPTSVNSVVLSGSSSPTLAVTGTTIVSGTNTGDQTAVTGNAGTATALQNSRTIGTVTGDATSAGSSFNGTANNTNALTLATVNGNVGSFGTSTQSSTITVNAKGLVTAASNTTVTPAVGSITGLGTNVATTLASSAATIFPVGTQDLFIPSAAMWPRTSNGCAELTRTEISGSLLNIQVLAFDQTVDEFAQFTISLPRNYNNGTIIVKLYWTGASGSGDVRWSFAAVANSDDDPLSTAFGTAQVVVDTFITANDVHITSYTSAITIAGTPADSDFIGFQIARTASNVADTYTADALLLGVSVALTLDAATAS